MEQVVTVKEMQEIEKLTCQKQKITPFELMVKAGKNIYLAYKKSYQTYKNILLVCGTGNNGGDALVFGEEAIKDQKNVYVLMVGSKSKQSESSLLMTRRYQEKNIPITYVEQEKEFQKFIEKLSKIDVIIDGLFGIGLSRNIEGIYEQVILWINRQQQQIISIDCPSGLHADSGKVMNISVIADKTYTIEAYKQGLIINDGLDCSKEVEIIQAGMEMIDYQKYMFNQFNYLSNRKHNSHKYHYKSVITIGGQIGVMGALTLAGKSALVSGAGLSTIATNEEHHEHFIRTVPEIMYETISKSEDIDKLLYKKDAILFGLGIKKITEFEKMIYHKIIQSEKPLILDASGILLLKNKAKRNNKRTIITPHYGEFSKLMEVEVEDISNDPLTYIKKCIDIYDCEVILKGPSTIYATQNKVLYINQGTPALAKAGSGDVLAGICLTYVARNLPIEQGILLHMLAGQHAVLIKHEESVLASDIIEHIPHIYNSM